MKKFASILLSMLMATGAIAAASAETYTGTAQGIGEVSVTLTVEDGKITAAEVVGESETKGIGYEPCADGTFADAIVAAQGVDFDSISGATVTSNAVKDATKKAMAAAGLIEAEDTTVADAECDVVIVGAGGAGMTAALQAVDSGVNSVIIVEKGGSTGGNTSRATGGMNAAKTAYQDKNEWSDATTTAVEKTIATAKEKYGDKIGDLIATNGDAVWGRWETGTGDPIADGDVTDDAGDGPFKLGGTDGVTLNAGGRVLLGIVEMT